MGSIKLSARTRGKISRAQIGKNNSMYGKKHSARTRAMLSAANRGKKNIMFGKTHSAQVRQKISLALRRVWALRRRPKGKGRS